jgi:enoyl-CoA hydratase/carnithine racemase
MLLTSTPIDARTAHDWGLVAELVPHADLLPAAVALARRIASQSSAARISRVLDAQASDRIAAALLRESAAWADKSTEGG